MKKALTFSILALLAGSVSSCSINNKFDQLTSNRNISDEAIMRKDPLKVTDEIFWKRHPELLGKTLKEKDVKLIAEYKEILRQVEKQQLNELDLFLSNKGTTRQQIIDLTASCIANMSKEGCLYLKGTKSVLPLINKDLSTRYEQSRANHKKKQDEIARKNREKIQEQERIKAEKHGKFIAQGWHPYPEGIYSSFCYDKEDERDNSEFCQESEKFNVQVLCAERDCGVVTIDLTVTNNDSPTRDVLLSQTLEDIGLKGDRIIFEMPSPRNNVSMNYNYSIQASSPYNAKSDYKREMIYLKPDFTLTVGDLIDEFESNSVVAEDRYAGKMLNLTSGKIDSIDDVPGDGNKVHIDVERSYGYGDVTCRTTRQDPFVRQLKKGINVRTVGRLTGESFGLTMENCKFYW